MAYDPTDAVLARRLLERAVKWEEEPTLTEAEVDDLMALAETDGEYPVSALNGAAATGWQWKLNQIAGEFSLSLEGGMKLNIDEMIANCEANRDAYLNGIASVIGTPRRRGTIASIGVTAELPEVS
jgi:hypothetical protein